MRLVARFGLDYCEVALDLGEEGLSLRALGLAGASFLRREIERGDHKVIGLGHGRTLAAAIHEMPRLEAKGLRFVSLLGAFTRNYAADPHVVMHRIAEKTGAQPFVIPVPFFANSAEDREVLLAQRGVADVFVMANHADLKIVGIGTVGPDAQLVSSGMIERKEIKEISADGGVGEMLGHFFDSHGRVLKTMLTARTLAVSMARDGTDSIVAIAGGASKIAAIRAVLASRRLKGLITDARTAEVILEQD